LCYHTTFSLRINICGLSILLLFFAKVSVRDGLLTIVEPGRPRTFRIPFFPQSGFHFLFGLFQLSVSEGNDLLPAGSCYPPRARSTPSCYETFFLCRPLWMYTRDVTYSFCPKSSAFRVRLADCFNGTFFLRPSFPLLLPSIPGRCPLSVFPPLAARWLFSVFASADLRWRRTGLPPKNDPNPQHSLPCHCASPTL